MKLISVKLLEHKLNNFPVVTVEEWKNEVLKYWPSAKFVQAKNNMLVVVHNEKANTATLRYAHECVSIAEKAQTNIEQAKASLAFLQSKIDCNRPVLVANWGFKSGKCFILTEDRRINYDIGVTQ